MNTQTELLQEALRFYNFANYKVEFIRHNENITYSVENGANKYLFRIHSEAEGLDFSFCRGNLSREILITGEIELLNSLHTKSTMKVQCPIKNKDGQYLTRLKTGIIVTVLSWIDGETLSGMELSDALVYKIGQMAATLHKSLLLLPSLNRCYYDEKFADKFLAAIQNAKECQHIELIFCEKFEKLIIELRKILAKEKNRYTIVHADFSKSNMLYVNGKIVPIDFSMCGYGIPELDLGDLLDFIGNNQLKSTLLAGYESVNEIKINYEYLKLFEAFSFIAYILIHNNQLYKDEKFQSKIEKWAATILDPLLS